MKFPTCSVLLAAALSVSLLAGCGSGPDAGSSGSANPGTQVDLTAFADKVQSSYELPNLTQADQELIDSYYPGLSDLSLEQSAIYVSMMSMSNGELALVQLSDAADVDKAEESFQSRIDYMVGDGNGPGGAWYPEPTRIWDECSRIVSNGNYVMMVVSESCDSIVSDFNNLF